MKKLIALAILLVMAWPAAAQDTLPAGCNVSTLSEILTTVGGSLAEEDLSAEQAVFVIDTLNGALRATRDACTENTRASTIDFSQIPQSRTGDGGFVLGDPDAPITIVEFADFMCPHCQTFHQTTRQVIEAYVLTGMAKFEYRFFPVVDANLSPLTASMTECAEILEPGVFWHAHDVMYELAAHGFNGLTPFTFAVRTGISYDDMATCIDETASQVNTDVAVGRAAGVNSTPTILVRYNDGELEHIQDSDGTEIGGGNLPFPILSSVIEAAQPES